MRFCGIVYRERNVDIPSALLVLCLLSRNPYLSVFLPPLVTKNYPSLTQGLKHNQQSLVTGYEMHATLKMLASGIMPENGDKDDVDGAWRRGTLFDEKLNPSRTCEEAQIPEEYCRCRA